MRFADIPGHNAIKERLRIMADSHRVPHALLLEGPEGSYKFALARTFAQYLHCANPHDGEPCGKCPSCCQHESMNHIDTMYSFPFVKRDSDKATIADDYRKQFNDFIEESPSMDFQLWRDKFGKENAQPRILVSEGEELIRRLGYMTRRSRFKIVLMWLPERMNEDTANKLLKQIEEPSDDTIFIFTSDNPRGILPTIYSRVQRIEVPAYTTSEIYNILLNKDVPSNIASEASRLSEGNINIALRLASGESYNDINSQFFDLFTKLMRLAYAKKVAELRQWSIDVAGIGREPAMKFLEYCCHMARESFLYKLNIEELRVMNGNEKAFVEKFNPFINEKNVEDFIKLFDLAARDIAANANAKIIFFDLAVRTIMLLRRK